MFDTVFVSYTILVSLYIIVMFILFWRRSKKQDTQLNDFLEEAKRQLAKHKTSASDQASVKVQKAFDLIRRLQLVTSSMEDYVREEYERIVAEAQEEKKHILEDAKAKAQEILTKADDELEDYREERRQEIEKDMVKLIMNVTQKVVGKSLDYKDHLDLIHDSLEEVKQRKERI